METSETPSTLDRLAVAQNPDAESRELWQLIDDPNLTVANTARDRLGLALRPLISPDVQGVQQEHAGNYGCTMCDLPITWDGGFQAWVH